MNFVLQKNMMNLVTNKPIINRYMRRYTILSDVHTYASFSFFFVFEVQASNLIYIYYTLSLPIELSSREHIHLHLS